MSRSCMDANQHTLRNAMVCAAVAMLALFIAWPFANLPLSDDFSWAFTVRQLLLTGRLTYNGWSSPSVIGQAYWGLLWVKCFGFSFNVLRASTIPLAAGSVMLTYGLAARAGLNSPLACFAALMLGLSPLFMPLAASFMTDVPGLFFLLLSMLALARGYENNSLGWITAGALAALIGGSSRQVVWIVPLIVLPYFAWLRRTDRRFLVAAACNWMIVLVGAAATQRWYGHQPYALPDPPLSAYFRGAIRYHKIFITCCLSTTLTAVFVILPAAIAILSRQLRPRILFALPFLILIVGCAFAMHHVLFPWLGNMICPSGILGDVEISGDRPTFLSSPTLAIISVIVVEVFAFLLAWIFVKRKWRIDVTAVIPNAILLVAFAMFGLELTRCVFDVAYDRHLLSFIPFLAIPLLVGFQNDGLKRMPAIAWATLGIFSLYAIASTQELDSLARARVSAIEKLESAGIAANQIEGGFEHDYWTESCIAGHINDARLETPADAYNPLLGPTPHSRFLYRLELAPTPKTSRTEFGSVSYFSFIPPFYRMVLIDRFVDPWWLNPARAATQPVPRQLISEILLREYPPAKH